MDAYSLAMTPAPSTASEAGRYVIDRIESLSRTCSWSTRTSDGTRGCEPVAMTMSSPLATRRSPFTVRTTTSCGDLNAPRPCHVVMPFRASCAPR